VYHCPNAPGSRQRKDARIANGRRKLDARRFANSKNGDNRSIDRVGSRVALTQA